MWRNIYGMSLYITLLCTFFIVFGKSIYGFTYDTVDEIEGDKEKHYTIIFNVFIWANLFNQFNCRRVDPQGFNVFENIMNQNYWFWIVFIFECAIQLVICFWLCVIFETNID